MISHNAGGGACPSLITAPSRIASAENANRSSNEGRGLSDIEYIHGTYNALLRSDYIELYLLSISLLGCSRGRAFGLCA